jgi:hypothetical protein
LKAATEKARVLALLTLLIGFYVTGLAEFERWVEARR